MAGRPRCIFERCTSQRNHRESGLCLAHRRMQVRGEELRPLYKRMPQTSAVCTGPSCDRPAEAHNLCKGHGRQFRQSGTMWAFGDKERAREVRQARWERASEDEKAAWIAKMVASRPKVRTEEHIRRQSASSRASWKRKIETGVPEKRVCACCESVFECRPKTGGQQAYCSKECKTLANRLRRYRLGYGEFHALLAAQNGKCAICARNGGGWGGSDLKIDHCHTTGLVRGLLCGNCNTAIGRFGDDPVRLQKAAQYLERAAQESS